MIDLGFAQITPQTIFTILIVLVLLTVFVTFILPTLPNPKKFNLKISRTKSLVGALVALVLVAGVMVVSTGFIGDIREFTGIDKKVNEVTVNTKLLIRQQSQAKFAAEVNGKKISKEDYENILAAQEYFYTVVYSEKDGEEVREEFIISLRRSTIDNLTQEVLIADYLAKKDIEISDEVVRQYIKENIVDKNWDGDWAVYENELEENKSGIKNVMHSIRRDLLIQKVREVEGLDGSKFGVWYTKLLSRADVTTFIDLYE